MLHVQLYYGAVVHCALVSSLDQTHERRAHLLDAAF